MNWHGMGMKMVPLCRGKLGESNGTKKVLVGFLDRVLGGHLSIWVMEGINGHRNVEISWEIR